jgi:all-trans-nonaprenyl-diphosphate synthase
MEVMNVNLKNVVGDRHPMLMAAAEQIFGAGGKKLRPVLVFLVARATASLMDLR